MKKLKKNQLSKFIKENLKKQFSSFEALVEKVVFPINRADPSRVYLDGKVGRRNPRAPSFIYMGEVLKQEVRFDVDSDSNIYYLISRYWTEKYLKTKGKKELKSYTIKWPKPGDDTARPKLVPTACYAYIHFSDHRNLLVPIRKKLDKRNMAKRKAKLFLMKSKTKSKRKVA